MSNVFITVVYLVFHFSHSHCLCLSLSLTVSCLSLSLSPSSQSYATEGLRTLVLAKKDLDLDEYEEWHKEYTEAR